jgi:hypothetical protein
MNLLADVHVVTWPEAFAAVGMLACLCLFCGFAIYRDTK